MNEEKKKEVINYCIESWGEDFVSITNLSDKDLEQISKSRGFAFCELKKRIDALTEELKKHPIWALLYKLVEGINQVATRWKQ